MTVPQNTRNQPQRQRACPTRGAPCAKGEIKMLQNIRRSLTDLLGREYTAAVCRARAALTGESETALRALADEAIDFYPEAFAARQESLMGRVGQTLVPPLPEHGGRRAYVFLPGGPARLCRAAGRAGRVPPRRGRAALFRGQERALPDPARPRFSRLRAHRKRQKAGHSQRHTQQYARFYHTHAGTPADCRGQWPCAGQPRARRGAREKGARRAELRDQFGDRLAGR